MALSEAQLRILVTAKDKASKTLGKVNKSLSAVSKGVRLLSVVGAAGVVAFGVAAVKGASDSIEAQNKANEVFGESIDIVNELSKNSANAFGISASAANEYAASVGLILDASGLLPEETAEMSVGFVKLAADIASFNNLPTAFVLDKLKSGLVGQIRPLRDVGILIDAASVQQHAYAVGIADAGAELTNQEKVQARYSLILEQSKIQQGDFARTSDDMANATKRVVAIFVDLRDQVGERLIPVITELLAFMATNLPAAFEKTEAFIADLIPTVKIFTDGFMDGLNVIRPAFEGLVRFILGNRAALIATLLAIGVAVTLSFGPVGIAVVAIAATIAAIGFLVKNFDKIKSKVKEIWKFVDKWIGPIDEIVIGVFKAVKTIVGGLVQEWIIIVSGALEGIKTIFRIFSAVFKGDWKEAGTQLKNLIGIIWDTIKNVITNRMNTMKAVVIGIFKSVGKAIAAAIEPALISVAKLIDNFIGKLNKIPFVNIPKINFTGFGFLESAGEAGGAAAREIVRVFSEEIGDTGTGGGGVESGGLPAAAASAGKAAATAAVEALSEREKWIKAGQAIADNLHTGISRDNRKLEAGVRALFIFLENVPVEFRDAASPIADVIAKFGDAERAAAALFDTVVERGEVTFADLAAAVELGAVDMAIDFAAALEGAMSDVGAAIFEKLAEEAAKAAIEASDAFAENFNVGLDAIEGQIGGAFGRISALAGRLTVEGAGVRLEQIELERRLLKIKDSNNPVTVAEAEAIRERIAALNDSMAMEKLRQEATMIQMQLDRDMLPTALELNDAIAQEIENLDALLGVFGNLSAGIFSVIDASTLMMLGFQELADAILAINAGLVAPGAITTGGLPGSQTIYIDQVIINGDPAVALEALGLVEV